MTVRLLYEADRESLLDLWLRAVQATHTFLSEPEIQALVAPTKAYLWSDESELWVLVADNKEPAGFLGMDGGDVSALFIAPEHQRRGGGRQLIEYAADLRGELTVTVNEQNAGAVRFYEKCGFLAEDRSETDDEGRPYPVLRMRRLEPS